MIGFLSGIVLYQTPTSLLVNVSGVGYDVYPSSGVLSQELQVGQHIDLHVHTHVREDQLTLFGFIDAREKELFRLLLTVSGIGPKTAMAILGIGSVSDIKTAIAAGDVSFFQKVSGVGKKSAQRVIVDLRSKIGESGELDLSEKTMKNYQTLVTALRSMGISGPEIKEMIKKVDQDAAIEKQIRQALKK